jgi:phosphoglycolate phosphatase
MRLVLFDLDGTLIDSEAGIVGTLEHVFRQMKRSAPSREALRAWIGPPLRHSFPLVLGENESLVDEAIALYRDRFEAIGWSEHTIYDGVADVIDAAHARGDRLAIVTTKVVHQARRIVEHLPFGAHFAQVYGPQPGSRQSEKAGMIAQALKDFGASCEQATMIGDRHFDIDGARANGVRSIGVSWGFGSIDELRSAGADLIVDTPAELSRALLA